MVKLLTVSEIAEKLKMKRDSILYIIRTRNIKATQLAGAVRLFDQQKIKQIKKELSR